MIRVIFLEQENLLWVPKIYFEISVVWEEPRLCDNESLLWSRLHYCAIAHIVRKTANLQNSLIEEKRTQCMISVTFEKSMQTNKIETKQKTNIKLLLFYIRLDFSSFEQLGLGR